MVFVLELFLNKNGISNDFTKIELLTCNKETGELSPCSLPAQPDIDGGLIGGASLVPEKFVKIIEAANQPTI